MKQEDKYKTKVYKLLNGRRPLSFMIPTRNTNRSPLLYFDTDKGYNRALRYARNQKSPFEDEQDGNAIIEAIIFEDGMLTAPANNPVLQMFLDYHPLNGKKFVEINNKKDAQEEINLIDAEIEALNTARDLQTDQLELVGRVLFEKDVTLIDTAELRRDILVFARRSPKAFLNALSNPSLKLQSNIQRFFDNRLIGFRNKKRDVYYDLPGKKTRMTVIPYGAEPLPYLSEWFKTDEGIPALEFLESQLEK